MKASDAQIAAIKTATSFGMGGTLPPGGSVAGGTPMPNPPRLFFNRAPWLEQEKARLRLLWCDMSIPRADLPGMMYRTMDAITRMAERLGLPPRPAPKPPSDVWPDEDVARLQQLWPLHTRLEIARLMERSPAQISRKAHKLKLSARPVVRDVELADRMAAAHAARQRAIAENPNTLRRTQDRRAILILDWPTHKPAFEIAAAMNELPGRHMPADQLSAWAKDLNLRRPADFRPRRDPSMPKIPPKIVPRVKAPGIARKCLCCGTGFEAETRFLRLCPPCRGRSEGLV